MDKFQLCQRARIFLESWVLSNSLLVSMCALISCWVTLVKLTDNHFLKIIPCAISEVFVRYIIMFFGKSQTEKIIARWYCIWLNSGAPYAMQVQLLYLSKCIIFSTGPYLVVITKRKFVGRISGHEIWKIQATEIIPFPKNLMHLNETQVWHFQSCWFDSGCLL